MSSSQNLTRLPLNHWRARCGKNSWDAAIAHCRVGQIGDPALTPVLTRLGLAPLFDLGVTLSDGTGSTAALSLIKLACALAPEVSK